MTMATISPHPALSQGARVLPQREGNVGARELVYLAALALVGWIDGRLESQIHFRDTAGRCLISLDEVVRAILENRLELRDGNISDASIIFTN